MAPSGKPKVAGRPMTFVVGPEEQMKLARIRLWRLGRAEGYSRQTSTGVFKDAIAMLYELEEAIERESQPEQAVPGKSPVPEVQVPVASHVPKTPPLSEEKLAEIDAQAKKEVEEMSAALLAGWPGGKK